MRYKLCKGIYEAIAHLTSERSKLAQLQYKKRHDKVARMVL